jgi:hypothetical protein
LITTRDILRAALVPLVSVLIGGLVVLAIKPWLARVPQVFPRLVLESTVMFGVYLIGLLIVFGQKAVYTELLRENGIWPFNKQRKKENAD